LQDNYENAATPDTPNLRIPEEYRRGFAKLIALEDDPFRELLAAFEKQNPMLYPFEFAERVSSSVSSIPAEDIETIVETLVSLYELRPSVDTEVLEFVELLVEALERSEVEHLQLPKEQRDGFKDRLIQLLDVTALDATSKALNVLLEHEHTLHSARIMTDLRPIFGPNTEDPPEAMLINHMLKLSYHDESEATKEFYIALDTEAVSKLIETLERATSKAQSLKQLLKSTGVPYIDTD